MSESLLYEIERELRAEASGTNGAGANGVAANSEPRQENLTDMGNSARMARMFGRDIKYSTSIGWLIWDGKRWRRDDTQQIEEIARQVVRSFYLEAADEPNKDRREALAEHARKSESTPRLRAMIDQCESERNVAVTADIFDRDKSLLNVENGTLDLRTGQLREARRGDFITKLSPVVYEPDAPCTEWYKFLETILSQDFDLYTYIQKVSGYCLTGDVREQEFYLLHGLGANGKTNFVKTLLRVLGDYGVQSPVETFLTKKNGGIPNDLARLAGARLVVATESEANRRLAESLVKALTGGDRIAARFLHREFFEFEPSFKLILATNHKPKIIGTDIAIWRRVRLVPFTVSIPPEEQDRELPTKLEAEAPGILRWAVEGCLAWQQEGLKPPAAVADASEAYRVDSDILSDFLAARCEQEKAASVSATEIYRAYADWSESQKDRERDRLNRTTFGQALAERGFLSGRNHSGRFWRGLRLNGAGSVTE